MIRSSQHPTGRHFLQIPGPSPVPERVLRAMSLPTIDHRGPEFGALGRSVLKRLQPIFDTVDPVFVFPGSGTGAWEAALVNVFSPGDHVLMFETGHFASLWAQMARRLGLTPELLTSDTPCTDTGLPLSWRRGVDPETLRSRLQQDRAHGIRGVCVVHHETSTGVTSDVAAVRRVIDECGHPALLLVDSISGLAAIDYHHGPWRVDVTVAGSQKGLMLPPGIGLNAVSRKALDASASARLPKSYWSWHEALALNEQGYWPYTPNTNLMYGLSEALDMLLDETLPCVFARHRRWAEGVRRAVRAWGLPIQCADESAHSAVLTGVVMPAGTDADSIRAEIHRRFDCSLGTGLGKLKGRMFRIGHLGDSNDLTLLGALAGVEMGLRLGGVRLRDSGVQAAMDFYAGHPREREAAAPG